MHWEYSGTSDYSQMNGFMVGIENYIFLERYTIIFSIDMIVFFIFIIILC